MPPTTLEARVSMLDVLRLLESLGQRLNHKSIHSPAQQACTKMTLTNTHHCYDKHEKIILSRNVSSQAYPMIDALATLFVFSLRKYMHAARETATCIKIIYCTLLGCQKNAVDVI